MLQHLDTLQEIYPKMKLDFAGTAVGGEGVCGCGRGEGGDVWVCVCVCVCGRGGLCVGGGRVCVCVCEMKA